MKQHPALLQPKPRRGWIAPEPILLWFLAAMLCLSTLMMVGCAATGEKPASGNQSQYLMENTWGIQIVGLNLSAAGYMLDFRYRLTDADKASPIMNRKIRPILIDQQSGATLTIPDTPTLGQLRQSSRQAQLGRTYFMMFANPGKFIQPGSKMTLVVGDMKLHDLTVEGRKEHQNDHS